MYASLLTSIRYDYTHEDKIINTMPYKFSVHLWLERTCNFSLCIKIVFKTEYLFRPQHLSISLKALLHTENSIQRKQTTKRIVKYAYNNKQKALCDTKDEGNCWKRGSVPSISHYQSNLQWHFNTLLTLEHIQCSMYNSSGCCYDNIKIYESDYYGDRCTPRPRCILLTKSNNLMCWLVGCWENTIFLCLYCYHMKSAAVFR